MRSRKSRSFGNTRKCSSRDFKGRRRPLKSLWAEQSHASKRSESFGPLAEKKIKENLNYTVLKLAKSKKHSAVCFLIVLN